MNTKNQTNFFDEKIATGYDEQWQKIAALRDAVQLLIRIKLSDLPDDARVLCVGVGTGSEVLYLAREFPNWSFTLVEPSKPMLDVCRQRIEASGITSRCTFHDGYLDSLPACPPFDAATALLVSQFILDAEERRNFFVQISERLRPDGQLISADLASENSDLNGSSLFEVWLGMQRFNGATEEVIEKMRSFYGRDVSVSTPQQIEAWIASSGFDSATLFFQAFLIHAWYARRKA